MAWYRIGTVAVTNGSKNVTGTSTFWVNNAQPGDAFIGPDGAYYEIDVVGGNGAMTIVEDYAGTTVASGGAYKIIPTQGRVRDMAAAVLALINDYSALESTFTLNAGNVGIGATPLSKFDIYNAANNYLFVRSAATSAAGIELAGNGNTAGSQSLALLQDSSNNAYLLQRANAIMVLGTNNTERMRIDGGGNVGIGEGSLGARLHVTGAMAISADAGVQRLLIGNRNSGGTNLPAMVQGVNGALEFGTGNTWTGNGGTMTVGFRVRGTYAELSALAADPSGAGAGAIYLNSTTSKFRGHTGSGWVDLH